MKVFFYLILSKNINKIDHEKTSLKRLRKFQIAASRDKLRTLCKLISREINFPLFLEVSQHLVPKEFPKPRYQCMKFNNSWDLCLISNKISHTVSQLIVLLVGRATSTCFLVKNKEESLHWTPITSTMKEKNEIPSFIHYLQPEIFIKSSGFEKLKIKFDLQNSSKHYYE